MPAWYSIRWAMLIHRIHHNAFSSLLCYLGIYSLLHPWTNLGYFNLRLNPGEHHVHRVHSQLQSRSHRIWNAFNRWEPNFLQVQNLRYFPLLTFSLIELVNVLRTGVGVVCGVIRWVALDCMHFHFIDSFRGELSFRGFWSGNGMSGSGCWN